MPTGLLTVRSAQHAVVLSARNRYASRLSLAPLLRAGEYHRNGCVLARAQTGDCRRQGACRRGSPLDKALHLLPDKLLQVLPADGAAELALGGFYCLQGRLTAFA